MTLSPRVPVNPLVGLLVGLLMTILLAVPAGVVFASSGEVSSDRPICSYDSASLSTTPPANADTVAFRVYDPTHDVSRSRTPALGGRFATKAGEEGLEGISRSYVNITKGSSIRNVGTNASHTEFADSLTKGGWAARTSKDGNVQVFAKDGAKYVLRSKNSSNFPGWTADFAPAGSARHSLEIRLGYRP